MPGTASPEEHTGSGQLGSRRPGFGGLCRGSPAPVFLSRPTVRQMVGWGSSTGSPQEAQSEEALGFQQAPRGWACSHSPVNWGLGGTVSPLEKSSCARTPMLRILGHPSRNSSHVPFPPGLLGAWLLPTSSASQVLCAGSSPGDSLPRAVTQVTGVILGSTWTNAPYFSVMFYFSMLEERS